MKTENIKKTIRIGVLPLAISLALVSTTFTVAAESIPSAVNAKQTIEKHNNSKDSKNILPTHKQVVKEAVDAFKATETALNALQNNQPKQALAALEVVSGNLHLLLARDPALGMIPIDIQVQILDGVTSLKRIKKLEDELDDLIDDGHYQAARPIVDSLVDEIRVSITYIPLATYPAAIDKIAPLIDAGKLEEAEMELITVLDTFVSEQEITPLAIIRAEGNLTEAFQLEHNAGLSKQETRDKIKRLVKQAEQHVKVAQTLGYGTKNDYEPLYHNIDALYVAIRKASINSEWAEIKKSISAFKNKIVHPRR
jgi:hypothetical protein